MPKKKDVLIQMVVSPELARMIKKCAVSGEESISSFVRRVVGTALAETQGPKTLRDEFAMAALTGLLASPVNEPMGFSKAAYMYADRMLAARRKT